MAGKVIQLNRGKQSNKPRDWLPEDKADDDPAQKKYVQLAMQSGFPENWAI